MTSDDENEETLAGEDYNSAIAADEEQNDDEQDHEAGLEDDVRQNLDAKWQNCFNRLLKFKAEHGHCLVPNRYHADPHLGSWTSTQRRQYKIMMSGSGGSTPMTQARARRLEEVGFAWSTKDPRHVPWEARYDELVDFKERFGHSQVPIGWKENVSLSNWISTQRQEYKLMLKGRNSRLTPEKIALLNKIDFVWEAQRGGPRRQERATVSVPEQAHPVQVRNKVQKINYAQMMANSAHFMIPGSFPMMPIPMAMPGIMSPQPPSEKKKSKQDKSDDDEKDADKQGQEQQMFNPQMMMMNPQMMASMGWPMMPASPGGAMAFGFFPLATTPFMMPAMGWPPAPTDTATEATQHDDKADKKRKLSTEGESEKPKNATTDLAEAETKQPDEEVTAEAPVDGSETESEGDV